MKKNVLLCFKLTFNCVQHDNLISLIFRLYDGVGIEGLITLLVLLAMSLALSNVLSLPGVKINVKPPLRVSKYP